MKKTIQALLITILVAILALITVFVFNPFNLRTKLIGNIVNNYLSQEIEGYSISSDEENNQDEVSEDAVSGTNSKINESDKNPLLNEEQEKTLEEYGVDVSQLPSKITPEMEFCFVNKLGQTRTDEIVAGDSPSAMEVVKARSCLSE